MKTIAISPDAPAVLAARLVRRLQRDRLLQSNAKGFVDAVTEALADEIHQATIDGTLRREA